MAAAFKMASPWIYIENLRQRGYWVNVSGYGRGGRIRPANHPDFGAFTHQERRAAFPPAPCVIISLIFLHKEDRQPGVRLMNRTIQPMVTLLFKHTHTMAVCSRSSPENSISLGASQDDRRRERRTRGVVELKKIGMSGSIIGGGKTDKACEGRVDSCWRSVFG